jgi:hypothetical protein
MFLSIYSCLIEEMRNNEFNHRSISDHYITTVV